MAAGILVFGSYLIPLGLLELYFRAGRSARAAPKILTAALLIGVVAIAIAATWYRGLTWRLFGSGAKNSDQLSLDDARFLLGVSRFDDAARIRERHRTLIAQNHPDTGGSDARASALNKARDILLDELNNKRL